MKFSLLLAACLALTLTVNGCSKIGWPGAVSQKEDATAKSKTPDWPIPPPQPQQPAVQAVPPQTERVKVAILLPLSGEHAALGQAMLNAAQQAVFDTADFNFELQPRDTAAKGGAEEATRQAVSGGAKLIIGPLFASDVPNVKLMAQVNDMMVLPLSTDTSVADRGIFVMGMAPGPQVRRVIAHAAANGAKNFAALLPSTPYGNLVKEVFRDAVSQAGGQIIAMETFNPAGYDLITQVKALAPQRETIDALFLPEGDNLLKTVASQLSAAGFDSQKTRLLGTGLWDVPDLGQQNPFLIGGWYAAPDPTLRRKFIANYAAAYGKEPPRLATLAYDATALSAIIAKRGTRFDETALTNPNGFAGLDGIFRLMSTGEVERGMAVNEVTPTGAKVVDPAPKSFVKEKAEAPRAAPPAKSL
ncbi:MAG: penicillin-binding protein activator [Alphaproteobacteria bacterium]|nr:penicillin-binding protein activator [Alphaproteobacteria bacterium]